MSITEPKLVQIVPQMQNDEFIRQIATHSDRAVVTTSSQNLFEFVGDKAFHIQGRYRSAIYSGDRIIALPADKNHHIDVIKEGKIINQIQLDFADVVKRNFYRAYYITEYDNGTSFIYCAFYDNDSDKENNIGCPLIFVVNEDLAKDGQTIQQLKSKNNAIQYFFETDILHNNDEDEDSQIPIVRA